MSDRVRARAARSWPEGAGFFGLEMALVAGLFVADLLGWIPLSKTPFLLAVAWVSLRLRGVGWRGVGLGRPVHWPRALGIGALAGVTMELFATFVSVPLLSELAGKPPDLAGFRPLVGNLEMVVLLIAVNWVLAAFGEEMVYRGYLMNRLAGVLPPAAWTWGVSLVVVSAAFGCAHADQGLTGMVQEGFAGFLLGLLYLASGRNLTVPIVAHGVSNSLAFILIYFDRYPGV